jgi:phosphatidylinositol alpha-1,6-mannosyltransferase
LRILYISHSFPLPSAPLSNVGGMQRIAVELHRALSGHPEAQVTTLALETTWAQTGIRTGPFLLSLLRRIPTVVREERIQVVLFSSMVTASVLPALGDRIRAAGAITAAIPVGRDVTLPNTVYQLLVPRVLRELDLILPISRATAGATLERGAAPERVHVVPCGVVLPIGQDSLPKEARRESLLDHLAADGSPVPEDALLLLSVGRHQKRKGFQWFVAEVMPRLPPSAIYLLGGTGPMTKEIANLVESHHLAGRVRLLGQVSEQRLAALYAGADLFVMPNIPVAGDIEGFGVVMLEAGAAGLPVLAADLEGIRDVIAAEENGWLVPAGDAAAFATEIGRFSRRIDHGAISARAASYVRARFGWDSIVEQYLAILRAGIAASHPE